jgi:branched-chain amino acid transport system ATP-binding protein
MLELEAVHAAYGATPALFGLSLTVAPGQVAALLGRNGAGKTTTLRSVVRLVTVTAGRVRFRGLDLAGLPPHRIAQAGIAYVPEERRIIAGLTVEENLRVTRRSPAARAAWPIERAYDLFPPLAALRTRPGTRLSGGEQQMLCIARALMLDPAILLLDEPTEGLAPAVIEVLGERLATLKAAGLAILLAEQSSVLVARLADTVHVIDRGAVRYSGTLADFQADRQATEHLLFVG